MAQLSFRARYTYLNFIHRPWFKCQSAPVEALVWRTMGGKHRRLIGRAEDFADDSIASFRVAALKLAEHALPFTTNTLEAEQERREKRIARFGRSDVAVDVWTALGEPDPHTVPVMLYAEFVALAERLGKSRHESR